MQVALGPEPFQIVYASTQGKSQGTIVNLDDTASVLIGPDKGDLFTSNPDCFIVGPLNSITVSGDRNYYGIAIAPAMQVAIDYMPGVTNWSPSPAQAAIQIATLGLATESTLDQVNGHAFGIAINTQDTVTTLGSPAQDGSVQAVHTALGSPAQDASVNGLLAGIPNNIAGTGAPLLALSNVFSNPGVQTFSQGQTRVYGPSAFGQISYEIYFSCTSSASETNPQFIIELDWINSASGLIVSTERWFVCGASSPASNVYVGTGRAKGDTLQVSVTYNGAIASGSGSIVILRSSRVYVRDDFRSTVFNGFPFTPNGGYDPNANLLLETLPTVSAGGQVSRSMALYAGTVRLTGSTQAGAANVTIITQDATFSNNVVFEQNIAANSIINSQLDLPRKQCILILTNNGSGSQQIGVAVYVSEQNI